jgi:hypothetical protein
LELEFSRLTQNPKANPFCPRLPIRLSSHFQRTTAGGKTSTSEVCGTLSERVTGELRRLRDGNAKLRRLVADLSLDRHILQEVVAKEL